MGSRAAGRGTITGIELTGAAAVCLGGVVARNGGAGLDWLAKAFSSSGCIIAVYRLIYVSNQKIA